MNIISFEIRLTINTKYFYFHTKYEDNLCPLIKSSEVISYQAAFRKKSYLILFQINQIQMSMSPIQNKCGGVLSEASKELCVI